MVDNTDVTPTPWRWAVTTYSFTNEMMSGAGTTNELVAEIAKSAVADAVEVDAAQHFSSFPTISAEHIRGFRETVDAVGVTPTMMGGYRDIRIDARGPRSPAEDEEFLLAQVRAASEMGFFGVRISLGSVPADMVERMLPELDRLDIALLEEVQGGTRPDAPAIDRHRELRSKLRTDKIGFVFDSSLVMAGAPATWSASLRRDGVPQEVLGEIETLFLTRDPEGFAKSKALVDPLGLSTSALRRLEMPFRRWGSSTVAEWTEFIGETRSVHLKYWDLDDSDGRVSRQSDQIYDVLSEAGYTGFVCSEWGGHDWLEADEASAFDMTRRHRELFESRPRR